MKVIILCGGQGTRLKEETEYKPKPMVYVGGKPLLWHIMKIYSFYGYNEFILALGYKADYIKQYFLNQKVFTCDFTINTWSYKTKFHFEHRAEADDFKISFVDTGLDTLIGERISLCQKYIPANDDYFMVTYGDGVADINIKKLVQFHKKQKTVGTVTGVHPKSKYGLVKIAHDNKVTQFIEKPVLDEWVSGGFMVFHKKIFEYFRPNEMEHQALKRLVVRNQLSLYKHEGFWQSVDTNKELDALNMIWKSAAPWKVWK